jgi:hypothetical protein
MIKMNFTRFETLTKLAEGKKYIGKINDITKVKKGNYYEIKVKIDVGIIPIWVSDNVNPEHPLFDVFDAFIGEDESEAENFDEKEIIGTHIEFTVKNIITRNKKGEEVEHSFFDKVTPLFDESEEDDSNE